MRGMHFNRFSYGPGGRGMFIPLIVPLLGILVLFLIIKSGLWLPLLVLGFLFWMFSPMRRRWSPGNWREPTARKNDDIEYV